MSQLFRLDMTVEEDDYALAQAIVASCAEEGWEESSLPDGRYLLRVTSAESSVCDELASSIKGMIPAVELFHESIEDQDWTANWHKYFTPVSAGDFLIVPPWECTSAAGKLIPIIIEPKSAFGTGHHPTTTMCLEALSRMHSDGALRAGQSFLDMGTGTGILGIACVKYGLCGVGADIDPLSISNSAENMHVNGSDSGMELVEGSVEKFEGRRFDVVIANILAGPLKEMAPSLISLVRPGGMLVLSGFLAVQVPGMLEAYSSLGVPEQIRTASPASDPTCSADSEHPDSDDWVCFYWPCVRTEASA